MATRAVIPASTRRAIAKAKSITKAETRRLLTEKQRMKDAILKLREKKEARTWTIEAQVGAMIEGGSRCTHGTAG